MTQSPPKKYKKAKPIEKRCRDCGDSWKYGPTARKYSLCGGILETTREGRAALAAGGRP